MKAPDKIYVEVCEDGIFAFPEPPFAESVEYIRADLEKQPVEGLDVTDFCKPIDPGIARCVADHWWEMIGEESTNKKPVEGLEKAAYKKVREMFGNDMVDWGGHSLVDASKAADLFIAGAEWHKAKMMDEAVEFECIGKKVKMTVKELIDYYIDTECCEVAEECGF